MTQLTDSRYCTLILVNTTHILTRENKIEPGESRKKGNKKIEPRIKGNNKIELRKEEK